MKRGLFGLIILVMVLSLPGVLAAETFLDLIFGTSDESILFLKITYAMLIFIIFVKVSKESVFTEKQANLANIFSLLLSFFALRFTPDAMIEGFGWVIMAIAPFIIFYKLSAIFVKKEENKFSWPRFLMALFATLLLWFALGSSPAFGASLGNTPFIGGFFDELFSDIHYFMFGSLSPLFMIFLATIAIGLVFLLGSRLFGVGGSESGFGGSLLKGLLFVLGIALLLTLLGYLFGGALGIALPSGILGLLLEGLAGLGFLLIAIGIIYLIWRFRAWEAIGWLGERIRNNWPILRDWVRNNWSWIRWVLLAIVIGILLYFFWPYLINWYVLIGLVLLGILYLLHRYFRNRAPGGGTRQLILELQAGAQPIGNIAHAGRRTPEIVINPIVPTAFIFTAYRTRFNLFGRNFGRVALENAQITVNFTTGTTAPPNGATDNRGIFLTRYTAPNVAGHAELQVQVIHTDIDPATPVYNWPINLGRVENLNVDVPAIGDVTVGNSANIIVRVTNARTGVGVNNANVEIRFRGRVGLGPFNGTTSGGRAGLAAEFIQVTPNLNAITTATNVYNFEVIVSAPGFNNPPAVNRVINVVPVTPLAPLNFNVARGRVGATIVSTVPPVIPTIPVLVGQRVDMEFVMRTAGTTTNVDTATITIVPARNVTAVIPRGAGRYLASFTPDSSQVGIVSFAITASEARHSNAVTYLDFLVENLPQLNVRITQPHLPMYQGTSQNVIITVTNATTHAHVDALVTITVNGTNWVSRRTGSSGIVTEPFSPHSAGNYNFVVSVSDATGYQNPPNQPFGVTVSPARNLRVPRVDVLDAAGNPLSRALHSGETATINVHVEDNTGAVLTGAPITMSRSTHLSIPGAPLDAAGNFQTTFTAPIVSVVTPFRYDISLAVPGGYVLTSPIPPATINVEPPQMHLTINPINSDVRIGGSIDIDFIVVDDRGSIIPGVNFTVRNPRGRLPAGFTPPTTGFVPMPGVAITNRARFTPAASVIPGDYQFDVTANLTGYVQATDSFFVRVEAAPNIGVTVNWVPEPTTSNRFMLMNFIVVDNGSGNLINGAVITIRDRSTQAVIFDRPGPYTTNASGQLPTELRIRLGRNIARGRTETHNLEITVNALGITKMGSVDIEFLPPRSRLGGPDSVTF